MPEEVIGAQTPAAEVAPPADPPKPDPKPDEVPQQLTAAQLQELAGHIESWQERINDGEKALAEAKAAHAKELEARDKLIADLRIAAVKNDAILKGHFQDRLNLDTERRLVNVEGVNWDEDGKQQGEAEYRPMPSMTPSSLLATLQKRQQEQEQAGGVTRINRRTEKQDWPVGYEQEEFANTI